MGEFLYLGLTGAIKIWSNDRLFNHVLLIMENKFEMSSVQYSAAEY